MKKNRMQIVGLSLVATVISLSIASSASAVTLTIDNWRYIKMSGNPSDGGNEQIYAYPSVENSLISFDVSGQAGGAALGDGTLTMTIWQNQSASTVNIYQLNANNADVDLDDANTAYRDSSANLQWLDSTNTPQSATLGAVATTAPGAPISSLNIPSNQDGVTFNWNIPQATIQSWLDGSLPPVLILQGGYERFDGWLNSQPTDPISISFDVGAVPEPSSLALAGLGLVGLAGWGLRRRRKG